MWFTIMLKTSLRNAFETTAYVSDSSREQNKIKVSSGHSKQTENL